MNQIMPSITILIYQSENCDTMVDYLKFSGFDVASTTEKDVEEKLRQGDYDLCILDHYKTFIPGDLRILKFIRDINPDIPIIMVSNLNSYEYIVNAFRNGADDYLIRPYNLEELVCRIRSLMKRCKLNIRKFKDSYYIGNYVFDTKNRTLTINSTVKTLTPKEVDILKLLCAYQGSMVTKNAIFKSIWADSTYFSNNTIAVYIRYLRLYLKDDPRVSIVSEKGVGYSLKVDTSYDDLM